MLLFITGKTAMSYGYIKLAKVGVYYLKTDDSTLFSAVVYGSSLTGCAYSWPAGICL